MMQKEKIFNNEDLDYYLKYRLPINLFVLSIFLFVHCFLGFVVYFVFAFLLLLIIFDSIKNGITYLVFYYPFCLLEISINAILFAVLIGAFLIKYIIKTYIIEKTKPDWKLLVMIVVFFVYCLLPFGPYSMNMLSRLVSFIGIFLALSMLTRSKSDVRFKFNVQILGLAIVVASVFSLTHYFSPFLADYLSRTPDRFKAMFLEPNMLAMFCEVISAILVYYILNDKYKKQDIILLVLLTIIGVFTLSKTFLILMVIEYLAIFFFALHKNWKQTLTIAGILVCVAVFGCLVFHDFVAKYISRFLSGHTQFASFEEFLNVITTKRYELWVIYADALASNPLVLFFGAGIGTGPIGPRHLSVHNLFIAMVYQLGLVGAIMFVGIVAYMLFKFKCKTGFKLTKALVVPIIIVFMLCMEEDIIFFMN